MEWVPGEPPESWPKSSKSKLMPMNFNPSKTLRWLLFDHLGLPIINRGKDKQDGSPGDPSVAEDVMLELRLNHHHPIIDLLMERSKWQKYCSSFLDSYGELLDEGPIASIQFSVSSTMSLPGFKAYRGRLPPLPRFEVAPATPR
jgi:hypothetical protein